MYKKVMFSQGTSAFRIPTRNMNKLLVLLVVLAAVVAAVLALPAPAEGDVEIIPSMLVHEEHIPNEGGPAADKTLAKFVEELLALRGNKGYYYSAFYLIHSKVL